MRGRGTKMALAASAAAVAALAAASFGVAGPKSSVSEAQRAANIAALQARLAQYSAAPKWVAPGPPFDARAAVKGKTLFSVLATSQVPFVTTISKGMQRLAKEVGLKFVAWQNQGQVTEWIAGMDNAVSQKADLIDLLAGVNPALIQPQVKRARAKGIPVVASHFYGLGYPHAPNLSAVVDIPYKLAGELMADYAIVDTNAKINAIVQTVNQVVSTKALVDGIKQELKRYCPGCKLTFIDHTIPDIVKFQADIQSALVRDPGINYVFAIFDSAIGPQAIAAIRAANKVGKVKVASFNGTPAFLPELKRGIVSVDVGESLDWISYIIIDQEMRILGGLKPVADEKLPLRIFTEENVGETGPKYDKGYGDSYVKGFRKLWGLTK